MQKLYDCFAAVPQSEYFGRAKWNISNLDKLRVNLSKASLMLFCFPLVFLVCFIILLGPALSFLLIHGQSVKLTLGNLLCKSLDSSRYNTSRPSEIVLACWFFLFLWFGLGFFVCFFWFFFFSYCRAAFDEFSCLQEVHCNKQ